MHPKKNSYARNNVHKTVPMRKLLLLFILSGSLMSCANEAQIANEEKPPAYEQFHDVFRGSPEVQDIQNLMDAILDQYQMEKNELNKQKFGSALLKMQQISPTGITEMEIMKYMYQHPDTSLSLPTAIATATAILEQTN